MPYKQCCQTCLIPLQPVVSDVTLYQPGRDGSWECIKQANKNEWHTLTVGMQRCNNSDEAVQSVEFIILAEEVAIVEVSLKTFHENKFCNSTMHILLF